MLMSVAAAVSMSTFETLPKSSSPAGPACRVDGRQSTSMGSNTDSIGKSTCSIKGLSRKQFKLVAGLIFREVRTPLHNAVLAVQNIVSEESFPLTAKVLVEWEALCDSLVKISRVLNDINDCELGVSDISEGSSNEGETDDASIYHTAQSTPVPSPAQSDSEEEEDEFVDEALCSAFTAPPAPDADSGFSDHPPPSGASSRRMIVRDVTRDKDLNRKHRKRSRSLDDVHLLPAQGTTAAARTALPGRFFAEKVIGRDLPRRPALVRRGTSDVSAILKRWRLPTALPPSSSSDNLCFSFPQPAVSNASTFPRKASSTMELGQGLHVLVVDDDILTRKLMERSLARMGCAVDTAENGRVALEMMASSSQIRSSTWCRYDIVFLDNQMPVMSGLDAVATLRSVRRGDLVIGVTGNALLSDRQEFLSAGADHVLTKPVFEGNLIEVIRVAQERRVQTVST